MNLEDQNVDLKSRLKQLDGGGSQNTLTKAPSIHVEGEPKGNASESQIVESEKYKHLLNEGGKLKEYKEEAEAEKKKMNSELDLLRKLVSQLNIDREAEWEIIAEKMKKITSGKDQLNRLRDELVGKMSSFAKQLRDLDELLTANPDEGANLLQADSLKKVNNVLQRELEEMIKKEKDWKKANEKLWRENAKLLRGRTTSIHAMDSSFQQEVTRLVTENVDLRERVEKLEKELEEYRKDQGTLQPFRQRAQSMKDMEQKRRAQTLRSGQEPRAGKLSERKRCGVCSKSFKYKGGLIRHENIHNPDKLFKCSYCERGFNDISSLKRHIKRKVCKKSHK